MLPSSYIPRILHEQNGRHRDANARTAGFQPASRFVCRHDLLLCLTPLQSTSPPSVLSQNLLVSAFARFPRPCTASFYRHLFRTRQQYKTHRPEGGALAAYWKSPYRQCSGPAAWFRHLTTLGPEHCRYSPNDFFPTAIASSQQFHVSIRGQPSWTPNEVTPCYLTQPPKDH